MILKLVLVMSLVLAVGLSGKIPIQAHSFNDFDYLQNLLAKGIDYYKLDVSMANRKSCEKFSTWDRTKKCYNSSQYIQQICCLAFRGDASSRPSFGYPFNTSHEYIKFLENNLAEIAAYEPKRRIMFAINFQYEHSFDDFITEQFLAGLADVMAKYPHNLLLGTGSDSFILEYDRVCFGKGAPECTQVRRKISKSNMFLQSGAANPYDPRDYYKRYRNYNIFYKGIENHCQNGFPEWINKYPEFPLIFWQPSNEKQIQFVLNHFLSPSCMKKHGRNLTGMAMATNIDSEMFDIYMKKAIDTDIPKSSPNLQKQSALSPAASNISWSLADQKLIITERINLKLAKLKVGNTQIVYSVSSEPFLTNKVLFQRWEYDNRTQSMRVTASREHSVIIKQAENIEALMQDGKGQVILLTSNKEVPTQSTIYYFESNTFELVGFRSWVRVNAACMKGNELIYVTCDAKLTNCSIKGAIQFKQTTTYFTFYAQAFFSKITSIETFQSSFMVLGQSAVTPDLAVAILIKQGRVYAPDITLSLGQNPKIFKKQSGKQFGVLLSDAMCHSALLINNNDMNKCNFFNEPEFQSLRNVRGLVNLLEFDLADIFRNTQIVSPCSRKISLTKLMNGGNPDIVELSTLGSYLLATQYLRIEDQDLVSSLFCGGSNYDKAYKYKLKSSMLTTMYKSNINTLGQRQSIII